jgi:rhodanese-related sulfurtransferase
MSNRSTRKAAPRTGSATPGRATTSGKGATSRTSGKRAAAGGRLRPWALLGTGVVVALIAVVVGIVVLTGHPSTAGASDAGTIVQGNGGHWTNITPDTLATKLKAKDFTLLNVKTPYIGEIAGTDLYIPYTDISARASELPVNKAASIVVYCRSGHESAIAAQTLLDLGYTNILNLDGGMDAWTAGGRQLVQVNRT